MSKEILWQDPITKKWWTNKRHTCDVCGDQPDQIMTMTHRPTNKTVKFCMYADGMDGSTPAPCYEEGMNEIFEHCEESSSTDNVYLHAKALHYDPNLTAKRLLNTIIIE